MNKKTIVLGVAFLIILVILIILLSNRNTSSEDQNTDQQVTLVWWNLFEPAENVQPLIDEYTTNNPNVKIQYYEMGTDGIDKYKERITAELSDDEILTSPDIFPMSNGWLGSFRKNLVTAPSGLFSSTDLDDFYPIVKTDFYSSGELYALPLYLDGLAVIYNKDRLKEAGLNVPNRYWSDFQVEAQKLTVRDSSSQIIKPGFSAYLFDNTEFAFETLNLMFLQNGVQFYDSTGARVKLESQSEASNTIKFYKYFIDDNNSTWDKNQKEDIVSFLEGKLAMYIAPSWRLINILNYNYKYGLNLNIGIAPIPQLLGRDEAYYSAYWGLAVSKDSRYSEESWKFIKYITQAEQLKKLNETIIVNGRPIGIIYPRISMASQLSNDQYLGAYASSLLHSRTWDMYDSDLMKEAFYNVLSKGNLSPKELDSAIDSVINQ